MVMDVRSFGDAENEEAASGGGRTVVSVPEMATGRLRQLVLEPVMGWPRMEEVRELVTVALAVVTEVLKVVAESLKCSSSCLWSQV